MKILIVSATKRKNFTLGEEISGLLNADHEMICLEDYPLPLFVPGGEKADQAIISELVSKFENVDGFIFCAPEYNGSIPPILTNLIAWISVSTDQWREVFNGKKALLGTHSGGDGNNIIQSMKIQLGHLGTIVLPRTIIVNSYTKFNPESTRDKIEQLIELL